MVLVRFSKQLLIIKKILRVLISINSIYINIQYKYYETELNIILANILKVGIYLLIIISF
jgi:hypothetical protein